MSATYLRPVRKASAPVLFLVGMLVVGAVAGLTFAVASALDLDDDGDVAAGPDETIVPDTESPTVVTTPADQVEVTGTAIGITIEGGTLPRIDTPLMITAPPNGGATLTDVEVDSELEDIVWDAGRPFDLRAEGLGIRPPVVNLFAAPSAITIGFVDAVVNELEPGAYGLQTPVAIGREGLATPVDSVAFEATVESTISFHGGATTAILPRQMELQAAGRVLIQGQLTVTQPSGATVDVDQIELPAGDFQVSFTPRGDGSGYDVTALLRGPVVT
jgi:hypothetical protein